MFAQGLNSVKVKDYELPFIKYGHGEKNLLMIPGLSYIMIPAQTERRKAFSKTYAEEFTCYYPERRPNITPGYTTEEMAEDIFDFCEALGIKEACVQGFSQGGMIAQWLAINHPELVKAAVLTVTLSKPNDSIRETEHWTNLLKSEDDEAALKYMRNISYSDEWLSIHKDDPVEPVDSKHCRAIDQYEIMSDACVSHNAFDRLHEIKCPVLVNGGWKDHVVSGQASIEIASELKCDLHMYAKLGHGLYEEDVSYHARVFDWLMHNCA